MQSARTITYSLSYAVRDFIEENHTLNILYQRNRLRDLLYLPRLELNTLNISIEPLNFKKLGNNIC